jgi:hypothetical protein
MRLFLSTAEGHRIDGHDYLVSMDRPTADRTTRQSLDLNIHLACHVLMPSKGLAICSARTMHLRVSCGWKPRMRESEYDSRVIRDGVICCNPRVLHHQPKTTFGHMRGHVRMFRIAQMRGMDYTGYTIKYRQANESLPNHLVRIHLDAYPYFRGNESSTTYSRPWHPV